MFNNRYKYSKTFVLFKKKSIKHVFYFEKQNIYTTFVM